MGKPLVLEPEDHVESKRKLVARGAKIVRGRAVGAFKSQFRSDQNGRTAAGKS
jgi:hypothetical protein